MWKKAVYGEAITAPVILGFQNLTEIQKGMAEDQGWSEEDFISPSTEPFWEVEEFLFFESGDLHAVQRLSLVWDTNWEYTYELGIQAYVLRFERNSAGVPINAIYCTVDVTTRE